MTRSRGRTAGRAAALPRGPVWAVLAGVALLGAGCAGAHRAVLATEPAVPAGRDEVAPPPATPAPRPIPDGAGVHHVVDRGQTLWRIAFVYGVPVAELARVNGIDDGAPLEVGHTLFIPGATARREVPPHPAPLPAPPPLAQLPQVPPPPAVATGPLDFGWPIPGGEILSRFRAPRPGRRHAGVDIRGVRGQPVLAVEAGTVVRSTSMRGYGKTVIVDHGEGWRTLYAHNSRLLVRSGDRVRRGETIALVGRTGNATTEHCHFEIRRNGVPVDPLVHVSGSRR